MIQSNVVPLVEITRGSIVESIQWGAAVVVDSAGRLLASVGDPQTTAFLRSSAKPFQALPFVEMGGVERFGLTERELSLMCASHRGTDDHVIVLKGMQAKIGVSESDLMCGVHAPSDSATWKAMILRGEDPTPYRHNCSGKHTGMLGQAVMRGLPTADYVNPQHPVQQAILETFAQMTGMEPDQVVRGTDGCSVPTFAIPLYNTALGFARLADPVDLPEKRAAALAKIFRAMPAHPDMVAGPGAFDTVLMQTGHGQILCKGGAEGYQAIAVAPGIVAPGAPGIGIAFKISDGDLTDRARPVVALAILKSLGILNAGQVETLAGFDRRPIHNFRHLEVGEIRPCFTL